LKYEEYPEVTKSIGDLLLKFSTAIQDKTMMAGLHTIRVSTTSIATVKDGILTKQPLKLHESTYFVTYNELIDLDFVSIRTRFLKDARAEVEEYDAEFIQLLESVGWVYNPASGTQFIDWFIQTMDNFKKLGSEFSNLKWGPALRRQLHNALKDPSMRLKLRQWLEENNDFVG
jgi:hypothetical protein